MVTIDRSAHRVCSHNVCSHKMHSFPAATRLVLSSVLTAWLVVGTAVAQESGPGVEGLEEVTVTGTRIRRNGYETPTPVAVLSAEALQNMPVNNIAEAVNRLPMFAGSQTSHNTTGNISSGTAGSNFLNLRGLGPNRTLILLDGKRVVGAALGDGGNRGSAVDISAFPTGLIKRVEVVTGGASAVYGSDAIAGVVNFILDKDYTGVKASLQAGSTTHGDGENYLATLTAGIPFAEDRGHLLFNYEHAYDAGIMGKPRDWAEKAYQWYNNPDYTPTNGQPQYLALFQTGLAAATPGGLILDCPTAAGTACPLRGTMFLNGGTPAQFEFGPVIDGVLMSGGDWRISRIDKDIAGLGLHMVRDNVFARASYDVSASTTAYAEVLRGRARTKNWHVAPNFHLGNLIVPSGNPFIPAPVQAQMTALGIPSFRMGTTHVDAGDIQGDNTRTLERYVVGVKGEFDAVDTNWLWDASYVRNSTDVLITAPNIMDMANVTRALDAVIDGGRIVCSVNADADPSNDDPACVPYNPMGIGVNSQLAVDYSFGTGRATTLLEQDVLAANATGEPFSTWAGPVGVAVGAAYRTEEVSGTQSAIDKRDGFLAGNYHASFGKYDVTEGYLETVVPLAADQPFAESLDVTGAARWTDYSTSGEVVTWKLGASWAPIDDLRFRLTRSRDIRAPSLGNLFNAGSSGTGTTFDPFTGETVATITQGRGNPELVPEEADSTGIGVVYQPSWLRGFSASVDYYDIDIQGAIVTVGDVVARCFAGETELCDNIQRDATGAIHLIVQQPENILAQRATGYDIEASYTFPFWDGDLSLRAFVTYVDSLTATDAGSVTEGAGVTSDGFGLGTAFGLNAPELRYLTWATYDNYPVTITLSMRGVGAGVYNNAYIECVPGSCPTSTPAHPTANTNHIDGAQYFDLGFTYAIFGENGEIFFSAQNVLDTDPAIVASNSFYSGQANDQFFDRVGRMLHAGVNYSF